MKTIELLQAEIQMKEHAISKLQAQIKDKEAQQNAIECDPVCYRCGLNDFTDSYFDKEETDEYRSLQEEIDQLESDIEDLESEIEDLHNDIEDLENEESED